MAASRDIPSRFTDFVELMRYDESRFLWDKFIYRRTMAAGNHEKDNRTKDIAEHHIKSAIETGLSNTEQSYEEFMESFIGLKKEDVIAHHTREVRKMLKRQGKDNDPSHGQSLEADMNEVKGHKPRFDSREEDIDTEELDEGINSPTRQATDLSPGHRFVQMDNFVDDVELLEDDTQGRGNDENFASSHYVSSFGLVDSSASSPLKRSEDPIRRIERAEDRTEEERAPSQAHLELGRGCEMETLPREADEEYESSFGIVDSSTTSSLKLSEDPIRRIEGAENRTEEERAPSQAHLELGRGFEMETLPREAEEEYESSFGIVDSSTTSSLKLSEDLIGRIKGVNGGEDEPLEVPLELRRGCEMKTLPGEAEEAGDGQASSMSDDAVHRTELQMSSRRSQEGVTTNEDSKPETCLEMSTDEVQPFSLDMDFDYDNVVLTPKWDLNHAAPGWKPSH